MKPFVFHPLIIALYFPIFLFSRNIGRYSAGVTLFPVLLLLVIATVMYMTILLIVKNQHKAAFVTSINLLLLFTYGGLYTLLKNLLPESVAVFFGAQKMVLVFDIGVNITLFWACLKMNLQWPVITSLINRISGVLIVFPLFQIFTFTIFEKSEIHSVDVSSYEDQIKKLKDDLGENSLPDIYHIVMDAYPRMDVLKDVYGYDNFLFINYLKENGFHIGDSSYSNYAFTGLSMSSMLNMDYLTNQNFNSNSQNWKSLQNLNDNSIVVRILRKIGYMYYIVPHGWEDKLSDLADVVISPTGSFKSVYLNEFQNGLLYMTPFPYMLSSLRNPIVNKNVQHRNRLLFGFNFLENAYALKGPKYIYCHMLAPHSPIVFGPDNESLDDIEDLNILRLKDTLKLKAAIVGEIQYLNKRLIKIFDIILNKSNKDVIILLQSDHGESVLQEGNNRKFFWQRFGNLAAIHLKGGKPDSSFYKKITPVNYFRFIFNADFNMTLPLLEDKVIFSTHTHPFLFIDISDSLYTSNVEYLNKY